MRRLLRSCVVGAVLVAAMGGGSAAAGASVGRGPAAVTRLADRRAGHAEGADSNV